MNDKVISIIESAVGDDAKRQGQKGDYGFKCPFCNHHKKKLYVNLDPDAEQYQNYQCWVCGESGKSLFTLLKKTNSPEHLFKRLSKYDEEQEITVTLPQEFRPLWKSQDDIVSGHALNRLSDRGVTYGDVVKHRIGYCRSGDYSKRMIIPSYDSEGKINYFVGRRIWSSQFPKYKNPSAPRDSIIPFESTINWREAVTIVEGPFDAIACRRNAIPLLGNNLPESLTCRLMEAPTTEVNVALDADMQEVALEIAEKFVDEDFTVRLIDLPEGKDPGDLGFENMQRVIRETDPLDFDEIVHRRLWS